MKRLHFMICCLATGALLILSVPAQGAPNFAPGRFILESGAPMLGDNVFSDPAVADWNGDGKKDLMVGVFYEGNIIVYLNQGSDSDPVFGPGTLLEADGVPISVSYG